MPKLSTVPAIVPVIVFALWIVGAARSQDAPLQEAPPTPQRKRLPRDEDRVKPQLPPAARSPRAEVPEDRVLPRDRLLPRDDRPDRIPLPPGTPGRFGPGMLGPGGRGMGDLDRLRREDPEMFKLWEADREYDRQTMDLAERYRKANEQERDALRKDLAEVVTKHFEARQQRRELELKRMDEQLKRLRDAIKRRQETRQQIIDRRVSELVGADANLDF